MLDLTKVKSLTIKYKTIDKFTLCLDEHISHNVNGFLVTEHEAGQNDEIVCYIEQDYSYSDWYNKYDEIFGTSKGYKECKELHDVIEKMFGKIHYFESYLKYNLNSIVF